MSGINCEVRKVIYLICIFICTPAAQASTFLPDPNNAALLYYQVFLLRPEPDDVAKELVYNTRLEKIYDILRGGKLDFDTDTEEHIRELVKRLKNRDAEPNEMVIGAELKFYNEILLNQLKGSRELDEKMRSVDPNDKIREYLKSCHKAIEVAQAASEILKCDWGILYSQGLACRLPQLVEIRPLTRMLCTDALVLAADGNFRAAFERCLMVRRFAHQVGDDTCTLYCVSQAADYQALSCIKLLLGYMKPDIDTLKWLKNQLVVENGSPASPTRVLKIDFEMTLQSLRMNADILENARQAMRKKEEIKELVKEKLTKDAGDAEDIQSLTDEELVVLAGKPYATFLDSAIRIMDSEMSYEKKQSEIQRLTGALEKEFGNDPAAQLKMITHPEKLLTQSIVMACVEQVLRIYNVHVRYTANSNALMAGIEVYLIMAKTGQLPEKLPEGVPKDPFTGRDFKYEITEDGFMLSLPDENIPEQKHRPYEFKVWEKN